MAVGGHLVSGHTKSCGCLKAERDVSAKYVKHGNARRNSHTPEYRAWHGMLSRCTNPNVRNYHSYGGRGIQVCERWQKFENFLADMGARPEGGTLDRIDNDKCYEPGNCRWASTKVQGNNRSTNRLIEHNGRTLTVAQWAEFGGIPLPSFAGRLRRNWSMDRALTP